MAMGAGTQQSRWRAGRDLWCRKCEVRYCLHCSDQLKKPVHWHHEKTCEENILEIERSKNEAERRRKDAEAVAQCVAISHSRQAHHHMHGFPSWCHLGAHARDTSFSAWRFTSPFSELLCFDVFPCLLLGCPCCAQSKDHKPCRSQRVLRLTVSGQKPDGDTCLHA
jgi:hypothetical protein